jgi:hypothetical protein
LTSNKDQAIPNTITRIPAITPTTMAIFFILLPIGLSRNCLPDKL